MNIRKFKILCDKHGKWDVLLIDKIPVCAKCISDNYKETISQVKARGGFKFKGKLIEEPEIDNVIPFPKKDTK